MLCLKIMPKQINRYFASIGDRDGGTVPAFPSLVDDDKCICAVTVTETDVLRTISKMKTSASSGPDGLPPVLFTMLKHSLVTLMYNQLLSVSEVLADWKKAVILPVYNKKLS